MSTYPCLKPWCSGTSPARDFDHARAACDRHGSKHVRVRERHHESEPDPLHDVVLVDKRRHGQAHARDRLQARAPLYEDVHELVPGLGWGLGPGQGHGDEWVLDHVLGQRSA